jgi:hypothetical protein
MRFRPRRGGREDNGAAQEAFRSDVPPRMIPWLPAACEDRTNPPEAIRLMPPKVL